MATNLSDKVTLFLTCKFCGKQQKIRVYPADIEKYNNGELVQNAFPYLTADERELIMTNICPDCWDKMITDE